MFLFNQIQNELTAHSGGNVVNDGPTQPMAETEIMPDRNPEVTEEARDYGRVEGVAMEIGTEDAVAPSSTSLRDVKITPLSSGFLVKVGCQSVAVETPETLLAALSKYYENPSEFERKWYSNTVINRLENILGK
jgi:hypothetical protein